LSNWFYEGVMMTGGVLAIDRAYFQLTGGRERWLYKVARKHAGGAGEGGFAISMPTLFEKSGAEGDYRRFKFEMLKILARNQLPGYALTIERGEGRREPSVRMRRRSDEPLAEILSTRRAQSTTPKTEPPSDKINVAAAVRNIVDGLAGKASAGFITDDTRATLRQICPGWDLDQLHADFGAWVGDDASRTPVNYQGAFIGFVKRHHARNKHTLRG
jgi:hypothetical protein